MEAARIHTTINLSQSQAALLNETAVRLRMKRTKLVVLLMQKMMEHFKHLKRNLGSVKYQKSTEDGWKTVHVFYEETEYEVCIDMRKFCKWSVSALIAMALNLYIDELIEMGSKKIKEHCDKNYIYHYHLSRKVYKNNICWHITWKLSEEFAKKFTH